MKKEPSLGWTILPINYSIFLQIANRLAILVRPHYSLFFPCSIEASFLARLHVDQRFCLFVARSLTTRSRPPLPPHFRSRYHRAASYRDHSHSGNSATHSHPTSLVVCFMEKLPTGQPRSLFNQIMPHWRASDRLEQRHISQLPASLCPYTSSRALLSLNESSRHRKKSFYGPFS